MLKHSHSSLSGWTGGWSSTHVGTELVHMYDISSHTPTSAIRAVLAERARVGRRDDVIFEGKEQHRRWPTKELTFLSFLFSPIFSTSHYTISYNLKTFFGEEFTYCSINQEQTTYKWKIHILHYIIFLLIVRINFHMSLEVLTFFKVGRGITSHVDAQRSS